MKLLIAIMIIAAASAADTRAQETIVTTRTTDSKIAAEIIAAGSTKTVKNAPFSAEAVSESLQVLADGNKIRRSVSTRMYRDSEGRFRREETTSGGTLLGINQLTTIFDPVESLRYVLNPATKTARRVGLGGTALGVGRTYTVVTGTATIAPSQRAKIETDAAARLGAVIVQPGQLTVQSVPLGSNDQTKTESLGLRDFDGVQAEGSRTVTTIPAGAVGNENPLETVYERWYSNELQMVVYSKHSDPRFGEQTYRLTNLSRSEPDRSLFMPPSDYKILAEPPVLGTGVRKQ